MGDKKDKQGQMPGSQAGLLTFFGDDAKGIKLSPIIVVGGCVSLIIISLALRVFPGII